MKRFLVISLFVLAFAGIAYAADIALDSGTGVANGTVTITDTFNTRSPAKKFHQIYITTNCTNFTLPGNCTGVKFTVTADPGSGVYKEFMTNQTVTARTLKTMTFDGMYSGIKVTGTTMPKNTVFTVYSKGWD